MRFRKIASAAALALATIGASLTGGAATAADADGDGIENFFETVPSSTNYWGTSPNPLDVGVGFGGEYRWTYEQFPIACNTDSSQMATKVLWVHSTGSANLYATNGPRVRQGLRAAASTFTASAQRSTNTPASMKTNLSPRFVTQNTATPGQCLPNITAVQVPWSSLGKFRDLVNYLVAQGYDAPNRKYLVLSNNYARSSMGEPVSGVAENRAKDAPWDTTLANPANGHSYMWASVNLDGGWEEGVHTIVHEMAHAFGGTTVAMPHDNPGPSPVPGQGSQSGHPTDCWDVLCYGDNTEGETWGNGCNAEIHAYRLDCNKDDYFREPWRPQQPTWWSANMSSFLWGNPQPPAALLARRAAPPIGEVIHEVVD